MPNYVNLWHAKQDSSYNSYVSWDSTGSTVTISSDGMDNAWAAWYRYHDLGWSDSAISAVVGMQCWECGLNPWRWQSNQPISYNDFQGRYVQTTHGYGLPQWTPEATYSDPEGYFQYTGNYPPNWTLWKNFFENNTEFRSSFSPNYSDRAGQPKDGDAQCLMIDFIASNSVGYYFKRPGLTYQWGYMPFSDFKSAVLGAYYQSSDTTAINQNYTITLEILIYQWLNNFGRGAAETSVSSAVRLNAANQLYTEYTGQTPPIPPIPRRKMPFWMLLRPLPF